MRHAAYEQRRAARMKRARAASGPPRVTVPWAPVAGVILMVVTAVLTASQWELVAGTTTGRDNSYRDGALSILIGLGGLHLLVAPGRHLITSAVVALAGTGVVLGGLLAEHDHTGLAVVEVATGALAVLCALAAVARPSADPTELPVEPTGSAGTAPLVDPGR
jgi:hypothetical protein